MDIETLAKWSPPKEVQTKYGPRLLRKAEVTEAFSKAWKTHKAALKEAGANFSLDKNSGKWGLTWWQNLDGEETARRKESAAASRATSADVDLPHPAGLDYMPFQKAGIRYALERPGVLIADEMGLGKTIQAIGVINADPSIKTALIICPKSLKLNWQRELERWLTRPFLIGVAGDHWPKAEIVIINYEALRRFPDLEKLKFDICITDEAHYIKSAKAQRSKAAKAIHARRKVRLTGTPIVNRPAELYNLIEDLSDGWGSFFSFAKRYANAQHNGFGWDFSGAANLDELQQRLREKIMVRRLKADVLTELPRKIRQVIELEPDSAEERSAVSNEAGRAVIRELRLTDLRAKVELAKADGEDAYRAAVARLKEASQVDFTEMARLRHDTAVAKLPRVLEHLEQILEDDDAKKVIVAAHHHDVINAIMAGCAQHGWNPVKLTGENTITERQAAVDAFQSKSIVRVFVASIQAAGVGITLTASSHVVFAELDWVPGNVSQMEDRAHRIGQTETVLVQHLVLAGSLDARMARSIVAKQTVIDSALDLEHPERSAPAMPAQPADAALVPGDGEAASAETTPAELAEAQLSDEQVRMVQMGLRTLAGLDSDHAAELNGQGFSKVDVAIGHSLAERESLTCRQAALGLKLCTKYRRQLPDIITRAIAPANK